MRRVALVFLLVGLFLLSWPRSAHACQCIQPGPLPAVSFARADAVFVGAVGHDGLYSAMDRRLAPWRQRLGLERPPMSFRRYATVEVLRAWKGVQQPTLFLNYAESCAFPFQAGTRYLIYAYAGSEGLFTGLCTRTGEVNYGAADLAYLETMPTIFDSRPWTGWLWGALVASGGLVGIAIAVLVFLRRSRGQLGSPSSEVLR